MSLEQLGGIADQDSEAGFWKGPKKQETARKINQADLQSYAISTLKKDSYQ